ncbi:protein phosphatase 2c containing protein [Stylonychia lemnae]|uniref:Protein phosphatase 2c containing protein n=1 Tax=Stylonychia lemnae TaxID=5949 RepID=A0A078A0M8_STYLE|nr:protein phosphatase 2c containing protein [Stylonychia lemnae]|eukprot:CDW75013.1 protein phosphatase 2c containing protein [Stylonychia lemnae]
MFKSTQHYNGNSYKQKQTNQREDYKNALKQALVDKFSIDLQSQSSQGAVNLKSISTVSTRNTPIESSKDEDENEEVLRRHLQEIVNRNKASSKTGVHSANTGSSSGKNITTVSLKGLKVLQKVKTTKVRESFSKDLDIGSQKLNSRIENYSKAIPKKSKEICDSTDERNINSAMRDYDIIRIPSGRRNKNKSTTNNRKSSIQKNENRPFLISQQKSPPYINLPPLPHAMKRDESGQIDFPQNNQYLAKNILEHRKSISKTLSIDEQLRGRSQKYRNSEIAVTEPSLKPERVQLLKSSNQNQRGMQKQLSCESLKLGQLRDSSQNPPQQHSTKQRVKKLQSLNNVTSCLENDPDIDVQHFSQELQEIMNYNQIKFENEKPLVSTQNNNLLVYGFGTNSSRGNTRDYNEDRFIVKENASMPDKCSAIQSWKKINLYAVLDGHGGDQCVDYVKEHLFKEITKDQNFTEGNFKQSLSQACNRIEKNFFEKIENAFNEEKESDYDAKIDKSGTCATILMFINRVCYIGQIGDGRCVVSKDLSQNIMQVTRDHKPNDPIEKERIVSNGGSVYSVIPGRLSVARTIGDIESKIAKYGGKSGVIVSQPDVHSLKINDNFDFMIIGCDGIFDSLDNDYLVRLVWTYVRECKLIRYQQKGNQFHLINIHQLSGQIAELIIRAAAFHGSTDNLTVIFIAFKGLQDYLIDHNIEK